MNIDQSAMCFILMDSVQQALHTNGKFSSNFKFVFKLAMKVYSYKNG